MAASMLMGVLSVIGLILVIAIVVALVAAGVVLGLRRIKSNNAQLKEVTEPSARREQALREIAARCNNAVLSQAVSSAADKVRFSDWAIVLSSDVALDGLVRTLALAIDNGKDDEALEILHKIEIALDARSVEVAVARRGSF